MKDNKAKVYLGQAERFFIQGEEELNKKDLQQSSEKFWGSASQIVKAYAEEKGWQHNGHAWLFTAVDKISQEAKDETIKGGFVTASALHTNFYEGWLTEGEIKYSSLQIRKFIDKIKILIENEEVKK